MDSENKPKSSLAIAYNTTRYSNKAKRATNIAPAEFQDERPSSVAEAIRRKQKALSNPAPGLDEMDLDDDSDAILKENYEDTELHSVVPDSSPASLIDKIRAKMRAKKGL